MKGRWKTKVDALIRLAEDQAGKPEGDLAREKLVSILEKHPEAARYQPLRDLAWKDITTRDVAEMHRRGISTDGSWTGATLAEAISEMLQDYQRRMVEKLWFGRHERPAGITRELGHSDDSLTPKT